jgi:hypothetical protein
MLVSCGNPFANMCPTETDTVCSAWEMPILTAPHGFIDTTCAPSGTWANNQMQFVQDCGNNAGWEVTVALPSNGGTGTYSLSPPGVQIAASFATPTGLFQTSSNPPSLQVTSGTITVKSETDTGGEGSVNIEFETSTGEHISLVGPVSASCRATTGTGQCDS